MPKTKISKIKQKSVSLKWHILTLSPLFEKEHFDFSFELQITKHVFSKSHMFENQNTLIFDFMYVSILCFYMLYFVYIFFFLHIVEGYTA